MEQYFSNNILSAPYRNDAGNTPIVIYIALFGMMLIVTLAVPYCIIPIKDSIESVREKPLSTCDNFVWTLITNLVCLIISCVFINITTPI